MLSLGGSGPIGATHLKSAFPNDQPPRVAGRRKLDERVIGCGVLHIARGDH